MTSPTATALLASPQVLWPDGTLRPGWVRVADGRISELGYGEAPGTADLEAAILSPGMVDMHCHGGAGKSFATLQESEAAGVVAAHLTRGTTSIMASLVTAELEELEAQIRTLVPLAEAGAIIGIHLEGPWLSPDHCGAHEPSLLRAPTPDDVDRLIVAAAGHLRMVTIAPELPGALEAIARLRAAGVVVALGHTDADADQFREGVAAGATVATHLCNGMRPLHHRSPGPVVAALADPRLTVELVVDGIHLHPAVVDLLHRSARSHVALITDAMSAALVGDGDYRLGSLDVEVVDGVARLAGGGSIAGSTLTMDRAVVTAAACGIHPAHALTAATRAPARALNLPRGVVEVGAPAHLLAWEDDLRLAQVLVL